MYQRSDVILRVLFDDRQFLKGLATGSGFSCFIEGASRTILFDTGADDEVLLANMAKLGVRPWSIDMVFLSNEKPEHRGGLQKVLDYGGKPMLFIPASASEGLKRELHGTGAKVIEVSGPLALCGRVWSSGQLGSDVAEHALVIDTDYGSIVVVGCAKPGIITITEQVHRVGQTDIALLMGGFHLKDATDGEIHSVVDDLRRLWVQRVAPCHCTGDRAREVIRRAYEPGFLNVGVGASVAMPWSVA
jgi:7,8-dihydropterin-6-yl-methyl-4-(beta-D-ribofuranosyl)aminobenzene 5'-phosphate synthase